ncbi:phosphoribosylamine--glycine ligase [Shimazuella sp. AN120528]|uniref:phosphoribosylamine--glycine ligase n=1 Tax=Shimazuella soli TaxID=1892854 RepID=UPI001F0F4417|nr:phosphoribosylamine--glycine ligase [Shimazuella soli]MCH5586600.1 phosphoribosylamine--glycine ligase [Shimazuella soli]
MRVLVIGNGGREHAIVTKLAQSKRVSQIYCAPGNAGTAILAENVAIGVSEQERLAEFAIANAIDLTIVGPEVPLIEGIVDQFELLNLPIFGPRKAAAIIEGSKTFAKEMMQKYAIPTAKYQVFTNSNEALAYVRQEGAPIVIKADGLAAGKGVVVAQTLAEAEQAIVEAMDEKVFGDAGDQVVIEEYLTGQEISLMAFVDGTTAIPMVISQDHKPVFDGDKGPNTGGMGTYSPVPQIADEIVQQAIDTIIYPMVDAFHQEGIVYKGVLYAGLMITDEGPKVIEFNARFGDPETQVVLPRLKTDLVDVFLAVIEGRLGELKIEWSDQAAVCVVMTSPGYPGSYPSGLEITFPEQIDSHTIVIHAGTKEQDGKAVTAGGRVLGVTALGSTIQESQKRAYETVEKIRFEGAHYRKDIAAKAIL